MAFWLDIASFALKALLIVAALGALVALIARLTRHDLRRGESEIEVRSLNQRYDRIRLYDRWGLRPLGNISGSEQVHMDAILALLNHYGVSGPAEGLGIGEFHSANMRALYESPIQQGVKSHAEAVRVGLAIEELDIADLRAAAERTRKPEILAVYADLERGSRNHLRASYRWMRRLGVHYAPEHLSARDFESIAVSEHEDCH